jgi:hypothetical protein
MTPLLNNNSTTFGDVPNGHFQQRLVPLGHGRMIADAGLVS